jgi:hypothetical protein
MTLYNTIKVNETVKGYIKILVVNFTPDDGRSTL